MSDVTLEAPELREYLLALADDDHLMGQQHTEWIGVAPFLEEEGDSAVGLLLEEGASVVSSYCCRGLWWEWEEIIYQGGSDAHPHGFPK